MEAEAVEVDETGTPQFLLAKEWKTVSPTRTLRATVHSFI